MWVLGFSNCYRQILRGFFFSCNIATCHVFKILLAALLNKCEDGSFLLNHTVCLSTVLTTGIIVTFSM